MYESFQHQVPEVCKWLTIFFALFRYPWNSSFVLLWESISWVNWSSNFWIRFFKLTISFCNVWRNNHRISHLNLSKSISKNEMSIVLWKCLTLIWREYCSMVRSRCWICSLWCAICSLSRSMVFILSFDLLHFSIKRSHQNNIKCIKDSNHLNCRNECSKDHILHFAIILSIDWFEVLYSV